MAFGRRSVCHRPRSRLHLTPSVAGSVGRFLATVVTPRKFQTDPTRRRDGLPHRFRRRTTSEAAFWSAVAPLRRVSTRAESISSALQGPNLDSHHDHAPHAAAPRPACRRLPEPPLAATVRASSRTTQQHHPSKEGAMSDARWRTVRKIGRGPANRPRPIRCRPPRPSSLSRCHLLHPRAAGLGVDAGDLYTARLPLDHEEDEVPLETGKREHVSVAIGDIARTIEMRLPLTDRSTPSETRGRDTGNRRCCLRAAGTS
jgi:hypothetical protein